MSDTRGTDLKVDDRYLAKLGWQPLDRFRAEVKKDKLIEIIRDRAGREEEQN